MQAANLIKRGIFVFVATATLFGCKLDDKTPVKLASPSDGPATEATYVEVSGKILPQYMTRSEWSVSGYRGTSSARHSRSVVPLVDPSWKPGDPIPMWVSGAAQRSSTSTWDSKLADRESNERAWATALAAALAKGPIQGKIIDRGGRKPTMGRKDSAETKAVAACEAAHGVKTDPRAPVVSWKP